MEDHDGNQNGRAPMRLSPLEMDAEMTSLIHETADFSGVLSKVTLRKKARHASESSATSSASAFSTGFRGLLRTKTAYVLRNALVLGLLGWLVLFWVSSLNAQVEHIDARDKDPRGIHQSSFGGDKNMGHPAGARAHEKHDEDEIHPLLQLPESNVGQHVPSLSVENVVNHNGHYWHDPYQSPFASHLYNLTDEQLNDEQKEFHQKMEDIKNNWGAWNLVDPYHEEHNGFRENVEFALYENRDAPIDEFPNDAWQLDEDYVGNFIDEAKNLLARVKEGIYAEYGNPTKTPKGRLRTKQELRKRDALFGVLQEGFAVVDGVAVDPNKSDSNEPLAGIAYMQPKAWDGLVHKLLHAMMTNDDFYVVLAGDAIAAGHGSNFLQSSVMVFHYLMEPIFDLLGMRLISRNMAMQGTSTTTSALAGADIYGEADILWYAAETPETEGQLDLFYKQAILSGDRVPVIFTGAPGNILKASEGEAWVGNLQKGSKMCASTTSFTVRMLPPACQFLKCADTSKKFCDNNDYNSVCWIDRIDWSPSTPQDDSISHKGFPGYRVHHLEGRKMSLVVLEALEAALDLWENGIEADGFPLQEEYWHVSDKYEKIRENVRTYFSPDPEKATPCELLFSAFPMVCHVELHGFTEWTPRITPTLSSLTSILHPEMRVTNTYVEEAYQGIDLFPPQWKIPSGDIDVHAIAIATAIPPLDDANYSETSFYMEDDDIYWLEGDDAIFYADDDAVTDDDAGYYRREEEKEEADMTASFSAAASATAAFATEAFANLRRRWTQDQEDILPGKGWTVFNPISGFCDGSSQSTCNRNADNTCLMAGHNDHQSGLLGDALSGWLKLRLQGVKEGVILARIDSDVRQNINERTEGWTSVNDKGGRELFVTGDFQFDYAINGKVTTLNKGQFRKLGVEIADGLVVYPLLLDEEMSKQERSEDDLGETMEVAMRIRSSGGRKATILLTHIYFA